MRTSARVGVVFAVALGALIAFSRTAFALIAEDSFAGAQGMLGASQQYGPGHTTDDGNNYVWNRILGNPGHKLTGNGTVRTWGTVKPITSLNIPNLTADYRVTTYVRKVVFDTQACPVVAARTSGSSEPTRTGYFVMLYSWNHIRIYKVVNGAKTWIGLGYDFGGYIWSEGRLGIQVQGSTIKALWNDEVVITVNDANIPGPGKPSIGAGWDSGCYKDWSAVYDDFLVSPVLVDVKTDGRDGRIYKGVGQSVTFTAQCAGEGAHDLHWTRTDWGFLTNPVFTSDCNGLTATGALNQPGTYDVGAACANHGADSETLVAVKTNLSIARLDDAVVSEDEEHAFGSICKVHVPTDLDGFQVALSQITVEPASALSGMTYKLAVVGPDISVRGQTRILHNGAEFMNETETEKNILPCEFAGVWEARGIQTGVVDVALIACRDGQEIHRDTVRLCVAPVQPRSGRIYLVGNGLAVPDAPVQPHTTIGAALLIAVANSNVAVARGTYQEQNLTVLPNVSLVGLGGRFEGLAPYNFVHEGLPILQGNNTAALLRCTNSVGQEIAALSMTGGRNLGGNGGGLSVLNCQYVSVQYCVLTGNQTDSDFCGGGAYFSEASCVSFTDNLVSENSATGGAGLAVMQSSTVDISRNVFDENVCIGTDSVGGGAALVGVNGAIVEDNLFRNNTSQRGGGIYLDGGF